MLRRARTRLTPGRYEILSILDERGAMAQRALQRLLGVARSTLSEALKAIERLGFISRGKRTRSGRTVAISLCGHDALDLDVYRTLEQIDMSMGRAFDDDEVYALERACLALRAAFADFAPRLLYDWTDWDN
jgi:DNA-binding MarR family transcriptional regulator